MSGSTNVVILFITNIPGDLYSVDEEYLKNEIDELNKKAFVIVVFVHPQSHDELRTIPYRLKIKRPDKFKIFFCLFAIMHLLI
jgi:hypothetical protein